MLLRVLDEVEFLWGGKEGENEVFYDGDEQFFCWIFQIHIVATLCILIFKNSLYFKL